MTQPIRTRPSRRLVPWALAAGVAIGAVPAFASATPVKPTADCTVVGGKDGLIAYFGYDSRPVQSLYERALAELEGVLGHPV